MRLFTLEASRAFAERIASHAGVGVAEHEERDFEDGEFKVRPLEDVQDRTAFVVHSLYGDEEHSPNDKLMRFATLTGALADAGASRIIGLVPYLAFARKDRRTKSRDPVTIRYVGAMLEAAGLSGIATIDVHNLAAFENAFRCRKWSLTAADLFLEHFRDPAKSHERVVVMSPDAGGVKRARAFQERLDEAIQPPVELGMMEKRRSEGEVSGEAFAGNVEDAFVVIIDDLISGGTTMARTAAACHERGAKEVHAAATHGVFGAGAGEKLETDDIRSIVITDTVGNAPDRCPAVGDKLVTLDASAVFADVIRGCRGD